MFLIDIILLVGGKNSRLRSLKSKEPHKPKALRKINNQYLINLVMNNYISNDFKNFILPLGHYKKDFIDFFINKKKIGDRKCKIFLDCNKYKLASKISNNNINILLLDTGVNSNKASRVLKVIKNLNIKEFGVSYGDGVGDIDIKNHYKKHISSKEIASVTAMNPYSQYGHFIFRGKKNKKVKDFIEKPKINDWANIGYFFFKKESIKYFKIYFNKDLEMGIIKNLAKKNKLIMEKHYGFWKSVDTEKDARELSLILANDKK